MDGMLLSLQWLSNATNNYNNTNIYNVHKVITTSQLEATAVTRWRYW